MTQEQLYWAFGVGAAGSLVAGMLLQPFFGWAGRKIIAWILSLSVLRRTVFYWKVSHRNTSYIGVIGSLATSIFGTAGVYTLRNHAYWAFFMNAVTMYGLITYLLNIFSLLSIEIMIREYDTLKARVRPYVDESFLVMLDSRFTLIQTKADYDTVIAAFVTASQTHPRT